jgi:probable addiction module antidote protein
VTVIYKDVAPTALLKIDQAVSYRLQFSSMEMGTKKLKNYKVDLHRRLRDPEYAAEYLAQVLAAQDSATFLIALKDVVEASGGVGSLAGRVGIKRPSLYKILSKNGNPTLATLQEILKPLGLRVSVALDEAA